MILPSPARHFEWVETPYGPALECGRLLPLAPHLFSTRSWALGSGPSSVDEEERWLEVAVALGVWPQRLARARQAHGSAAARARMRAGDMPAADILYSDDPALAMAVQTADCLPLLFGDARTGAVAAAHAGWRGLARGVPVSTVRTLEEQFGSHPSDLVVAVGPSIGACCYEVGDEVRHTFLQAGFSQDSLARWFLDAPRHWEENPPSTPVSRPPQSGRWYLDLWETARQQLEAAGVPPSQIFVAELCTASHPRLFSSYRRDGGGAGRLAGAIRCAARRPLPG